MPLNMLYGETKIKIKIDLTTYLSAVSKTIGDRSAVIFMLKSAKTLTDENAEYSVTEGDDLVVNGNVLEITVNSFTNLTAGTRYFIGVGIQFTGDTVYRELTFTSATDSIVFDPDVIRG